MSKLLEHEVKAILREEGIRVPESVLVGSRDEAASIEVPFDGPYFVKAQIAAGDRAREGGIVRAKTLAEARQAASGMIGSELRTQTVDAVLIERGAQLSWEGYAGVSVAENPPRRVLSF